MLTDEERRKIYEEEKARLEAQEDLKRKAKGKGCSWGWWIALGGLIVIGLVCFCPRGKSRASPSQSGSSGSSSNAASFVPQLELLSWNWGRTGGGGYVEAEGQVKNISSQSLRSVTAVATFYDKDNNFITSDHALIDYNPVMPGQVSPFKVLAPYNPAMRSATVEFKYLMGGAIRTRDKTK